MHPEEVSGLLLLRLVELEHVDGRMDNRGLAAVEAADPIADRGRVRGEGVRPSRRCEVGPAQVAAEEPKAESAECIAGSCVGLGEPCVAHRRVAVADEQRILARPHVDCARVRRGDDEVVGREVKGREVVRHVRQEVPPTAGLASDLANPRERAEPRLADDAARERLRQDFPSGGESEDVGLPLVPEEARANEIDDSLRAVHSLKPVVRDRRRFVEQHEAKTISNLRDGPSREEPRLVVPAADQRVGSFAR